MQIPTYAIIKWHICNIADFGPNVECKSNELLYA